MAAIATWQESNECVYIFFVFLYFLAKSTLNLDTRNRTVCLERHWPENGQNCRKHLA
jgi:hypothetical protein